MERVLDNLMNNAMRYSETTLRIGLDLQEAGRFCVWKTMAPALSRRSVKSFEPFVRLDPSRDRATGGCGLGLAIVRSIARAMGGSVRCEASELGGARFVFSWPIYHNIPLPVPA